MIGILGGMGTQAGLDFCNKLAIQYRGKIDQDYLIFLEDQSLLEKQRELAQIDLKILPQKRNMKRF